MGDGAQILIVDGGYGGVHTALRLEWHAWGQAPRPAANIAAVGGAGCR